MLINHGAKIDRDLQEVQKRSSALMIAVQQGLMDIVDLLIASDARLNDDFEKSPGTILGAAIEAGNMAMIKKLENAGARNIGSKINKIGNLQTAELLQNRRFLSMLLYCSGPKLLAAAISAKDDLLAMFLLQNNAHIERGIVSLLEQTPLCAALQNDNFGLVLALLEHGVYVTDADLTEVIIQNRTHLLPILLAKFIGRAPTAVSAAISMPSMRCLELLREANVDFGGVPYFSRHRPATSPAEAQTVLKLVHYCENFPSIFEIAAWKADDFMFKYILEWAKSLQIQWSRETVARALTLSIVEENHDRISDLMLLDSDLNFSLTLDYLPPVVSFDRTYNPLQAAVKTQQISVVRDLLVLRKADVNYLGDNKFERTPLQHAVELGNMEIFNLLLEHGADVNAPAADDGGATALQIAAIKGYIGIARRLLDLGADVNQEPAFENGRTALMGAAEYGRIDMLQMILDEPSLDIGRKDDFDPDVPDYFSQAVELAEGRGHYAAAKLLKSFKNSDEPI